MTHPLDYTYGPQEPEREIVLRQVRDFDDALALTSRFECREDVLFANELPIFALRTGDAVLSQRGFADFLAQLLHTIDGGSWTYMHLYMCGSDASSRAVDALFARCGAAGVVLETRPPPLSRWRIVASQVRSEGDTCAYAALAECFVANNGSFDELEDVARCRRAGVALRDD